MANQDHRGGRDHRRSRSRRRRSISPASSTDSSDSCDSHVDSRAVVPRAYSRQRGMEMVQIEEPPPAYSRHDPYGSRHYYEHEYEHEPGRTRGHHRKVRTSEAGVFLALACCALSVFICMNSDRD